MMPFRAPASGGRAIAALGIRHDDPAFRIAWPLPVTEMSAKDRSWPDFAVEARTA
jgi:dTDP-4-dehydrorhamnose 3,5-epimerase